MSALTGGRDPSRRAALARRSVGAIVAVVGLGLVAVGAWLLASGFGPTELLPGRVTEVTSTTNRHVTSCLIDVAWSGGGGSIESSDLYAALFPLDGETAVTLERSTLTGAVVAIELGGRSYRDENLSVTLDGGTVAVGLLMVVIGALLAFRRVPLSAARTWRLEQATIVAIAVAGVGVGLWMIAYGANGLWVVFGPRTTVTATLLDAANSYVDLAWGGATRRVTNVDLAFDIGTDQGISQELAQGATPALSVEVSSADQSALRVELDGSWYDVGPYPLDFIVPFGGGLVFVGGIGAAAVNVQRKARTRSPAAGPSRP